MWSMERETRGARMLAGVGFVVARGTRMLAGGGFVVARGVIVFRDRFAMGCSVVCRRAGRRTRRTERCLIRPAAKREAVASRATRQQASHYSHLERDARSLASGIDQCQY